MNGDISEFCDNQKLSLSNRDIHERSKCYIQATGQLGRRFK